jgi:hypothetical protein
MRTRIRCLSALSSTSPVPPKRVRSPPLCAAALFSAMISSPAFAHHGVAGVGAAGLQGPGAPIESATSANLPAGKAFAYLKLDHAKYRTFDPDPANPESDYANFWIAGLGYGVTSWLSAYLFVPYNSKIDEPGGFNTNGLADISVFGQVGFKFDKGLRLTPETESLDDLEDWRFTVFGGVSLPTGNPNIRDLNGNIDPSRLRQAFILDRCDSDEAIRAALDFQPRTLSSPLSGVRVRGR